MKTLFTKFSLIAAIGTMMTIGCVEHTKSEVPYAEPRWDLDKLVEVPSDDPETPASVDAQAQPVAPSATQPQRSPSGSGVGGIYSYTNLEGRLLTNPLGGDETVSNCPRFTVHSVAEGTAAAQREKSAPSQGSVSGFGLCF